jgi:hypothetical protein
MDRLAKVRINTCSRWELLRLPGMDNNIADKICNMRKEGVQLNRERLANIPYLVISPELFEMIDYTTTVSDFTDLDPVSMYQRLKKVEEPRVMNCFPRKCPHRTYTDTLFHHTLRRSPNRLGFINL